MDERTWKWTPQDHRSTLLTDLATQPSAHRDHDPVGLERPTNRDHQKKWALPWKSPRLTQALDVNLQRVLTEAVLRTLERVS
jgi:hypothetical protein